MSSASGIAVHADCVKVFNELKLGRGGPKYIIYKISDDAKEIVVDEVGTESDYEVFREKLLNKTDKNGKHRPSYAVYDIQYDLGESEGKRSKITFIKFVDMDRVPVKSRMVYATSSKALQDSLNGIGMVKEASDADGIEWTELLNEASKGKAK